MDTNEICRLFSRDGILAIQISGEENEATITLGDIAFSVPLAPVFGFTDETKKLKAVLEKNCNSRIQTQFLGPGNVRLRILSD